MFQFPNKTREKRMKLHCVWHVPELTVRGKHCSIMSIFTSDTNHFLLFFIPENSLTVIIYFYLCGIFLHQGNILLSADLFRAIFSPRNTQTLTLFFVIELSKSALHICIYAIMQQLCTHNKATFQLRRQY